MTKRRSEADRRARQCQRLGRVLRLLCLIHERHSRWNLDSLARELDCSRKTIQRDLLVLEDAGIPFHWDDHEGCYRVRPDFRLSMLDQPSTRSAASGIGEPHAGSSITPTPADLAASSQESADRLLFEAEGLRKLLGQLCQTLGQSGHRSDDREPTTR